MQHDGIIASFILVSNRPANIEALFENIQATVADPTRIEVAVKIDDGDTAMQDVMARETARRPFTIKTLSGPRPESHFTLWKSLNDLHRLVDPSAYFVSNINDEVRFVSTGWDIVLGQHTGIFPDHIYRLRVSRFKLRNYFDVWECWYAPENFGFHTKRWIDCHVSDSFQQCVAFYLALGSYPGAFQIQRDVPISGIEMAGQEAAQGMTPAQERARDLGNDAAWYVIMSAEMQTEICRRARLLQAHIWAAEHGCATFTLRDHPERRRIELMDASDRCLIVFSYRVDEDRIRREIARERASGELFHYRRDVNFINEAGNFLGPVDGPYVDRVFHTSRAPSEAVSQLATPDKGPPPPRGFPYLVNLLANARHDPAGFAHAVRRRLARTFGAS